MVTSWSLFRLNRSPGPLRFRRLFLVNAQNVRASFEIQARLCAEIELGKEPFMAVLILPLVVTIITGAHYFGRNVTKPVWLVLFILSVLALLLELIAYRTLGI